MFSCFFQEASTQERRWEGNGPGGELPAKVPAGEGPVPESRVPDVLPAAGTGTLPAGAQKERLLKFQGNNVERSSRRVIICNLFDNLLSHCTLRVQFDIKVSFLILKNEYNVSVCVSVCV